MSTIQANTFTQIGTWYSALIVRQRNSTRYTTCTVLGEACQRKRNRTETEDEENIAKVQRVSLVKM